MVATVRCEEIANEKYDLFATNKVFTFLFCIVVQRLTILSTKAMEITL